MTNQILLQFILKNDRGANIINTIICKRVQFLFDNYGSHPFNNSGRHGTSRSASTHRTIGIIETNNARHAHVLNNSYADSSGGRLSIKVYHPSTYLGFTEMNTAIHANNFYLLYHISLSRCRLKQFTVEFYYSDLFNELLST